MPCVVPQLKSITIGGAASGVGIESTSFKYGLVHDTLLELEVLLGDGSVVTAHADNEHRDLFFGFPNSYGTLGYALRVKAKTVPVKPFVALTHIRHSDRAAYFGQLDELCRRTSTSSTARCSPRTSCTSRSAGLPTMPPIQRLHLREHLFPLDPRRDTDYLTTATSLALGHRLVLVLEELRRAEPDRAPAARARAAELEVLHQGDAVQQPLAADALVRPAVGAAPRIGDPGRGYPDRASGGVSRLLSPRDRDTAGVDLPDPLLATIGNFALYPMDSDTTFVNFGFWDVVRTRQAHPPGHFNRLVERKVRELGGIKSLYSDSYFSAGRVLGRLSWRGVPR